MTTNLMGVLGTVAMIAAGPAMKTAAQLQQTPQTIQVETKGSTTMTVQDLVGQDPVGHDYVGMWVTADGHIRHELLPNGRYDEARGSRKSAYQGRYTITGNHIDYVDDTGFTADGDFIDGVLHHAGMVLYRER
jgi:Agrobacterium tumefaciens protein Atu4866